MAKKDKDVFKEDADFDIPDFNSDIGEYNPFDPDADGDKRKPVDTSKLHKAGVTLKYAGAKAAEGMRQGLADTIDRVMPKASEAYNTVTEAKSEVDRLKSDVLDKTRPLLNQTKIVTKQLLRQTKGMVPFDLDQKLLGFLEKHFPDEEKYEQASIQKQRDTNIESVLNTVFQVQTEQAMEDKQREAVNRVVDEKLTQSRHAEDVALLGSIRNSILYQSSFTKSIFTSYLKKDLELKFRHFYVAQDTLQVLVNTQKMLQERLDSITKNTGLPDAQKITSTEVAKKMMKEKLFSSIGGKTRELFTTMRENFMKNVLEPKLAMWEQLNSGLGMAGSMLETMNSMKGMGMDDEEEVPELFSVGRGAGLFAGMMSKVAGTRIAKSLLNKIPKGVRSSAERFLTNPKGWLRDKLIRQKNKWGFGSGLLDQILPSFDDKNDIENITYQRLNSAGKLTNKTIQTIEQIIPGYLSMQTRFLEMIATGKDNGKQKWDFKNQEFVSEKTMFDRNVARSLGSKKFRVAQLTDNHQKSMELLNDVYNGNEAEDSEAAQMYSKKRERLRISAKQVGMDLEIFKESLALSGKMIILDPSALSLIEKVAKGEKINEREELWNYGFKQCRNPTAVANWLMEFFMDNGKPYQAAIRGFQNQIEDIRETTRQQIMRALVRADEQGQTDFINLLGTRDRSGSLEVDWHKVYLLKYGDIAKIDFDDALNSDVYKDKKPWEYEGEKTLGDKIFDWFSPTGIKNGLNRAKGWAGGVDEFIQKHVFGKTDDEAKEARKNFEEGFDNKVDSVKEVFKSGKEKISSVIDNATSSIFPAIYKFLLDHEDTKPLADLFFYTEGDDAGKPRKDITSKEIANFVGDTKSAKKALEWILEHRDNTLIDGLIKTWPVLNDLSILFEEHEIKDENGLSTKKTVWDELAGISDKDQRATAFQGILNKAREEHESYESEFAKNLKGVRYDDITTPLFSVLNEAVNKPKSVNYKAGIEAKMLELIDKNEKHLTSLEGALNDIHILYVSDHGGYEGLQYARREIRRKLNPAEEANDKVKGLLKQRDEVFSKAKAEHDAKLEKLYNSPEFSAYRQKLKNGEKVDLPEHLAKQIRTLQNFYDAETTPINMKIRQEYDKLMPGRRKAVNEFNKINVDLSNEASKFDELWRKQKEENENGLNFESVIKPNEGTAAGIQKHAKGGNFIKDGTLLERFGGITKGITSVLNGTGVAGEAGTETILPHKANERFKKLLFNAISMTFGKAAAKRAIRALKPNQSTMDELGIDVKKFADGATVTTETEQKKSNSDNVTVQSSVKEILFAQLEVLRELKNKSFIGGIGSLDVDILKKMSDGRDWFEKKYKNLRDKYTLEGKLNHLKDVVADFLCSPIYATDSFARNRVFDVYELPKNKDDPLPEPLITEKDFKDGLYSDPDLKKRIKSVDDIKGIVFNYKGEIVITEANIKAGLCDEDRQPISSFARKVGRFARRVLGFIPKTITAPISAAWQTAKNFLFNDVCAVYRDPRDEKLPLKLLVTPGDFEAGLYLDEAMTKRITSVADIKGPVWDHNGTLRITENDLPLLCDDKRKPINTFFGKFGRKLRHGLGSVIDTIKAFRPLHKAMNIINAPFRFLSKLNKRNVDVYSRRNAAKMLVSAKDIASNLLQYEDGKIVEAASDITKPVWWRKVPENGDKGGNIAIEQADLDAGLIELDGTPIKGRLGIVGEMGKNIISDGLTIIGSAISSGYGIAKNVVSSGFKLGKFLTREVITGRSKYIDVYVKDANSKTGLTRKLEGTRIKNGDYYYLKDGKTPEIIKSAFGIDDEVYETADGKPRCLITKENLQEGLYDAEGYKLRKNGDKSLLLMAGSSLLHGATSVVKGIGTGIKTVVTGAKNLVTGIIGGGIDLVRSITGSIKEAITGSTDSLFLGRKDIQELITDKLLDIYHLLYTRIPIPKEPILGDKDGDGDRDGSYEDYLERHAKLVEERKKKKEKQEEEKKKAEEKKDKKKQEEKAKEEKEDEEGSGFFGKAGDVLSDLLMLKWLKGGGGAPPVPGAPGRMAKLWSKIAGSRLGTAVGGATSSAKGKLGEAWGSFKGKAGEAFANGKKSWFGLKSAGNTVKGWFTKKPAATTGAQAGFRPYTGGPVANSTANTAMTAGQRRLAERAAARAAANGMARGTAGTIFVNGAGRAVAANTARMAATRLALASVTGMIPLVGWVATGVTVGLMAYDMLKQNPIDLRWQRVRFPAYGLDKKGTVYEFAYEDYIKDLEKATFKAMLKQEHIDMDDLEAFARNVGFGATSALTTGVLFKEDQATKNKRKEYLQAWYTYRFLAPFMAYAALIKQNSPEGTPDDDFPDPTIIPYENQDNLLVEYKKLLDQLKNDKKSYNEEFDITDNKKFEAWLEKDKKEREEKKKNMTVGERAATEALESGKLTDENFDYSDTKTNLSQAWYNFKNWNWLDATWDLAKAAGSFSMESLVGAVKLSLTPWKKLGHWMGLNSTNYEDAWHKAKVVVYGIDEKVDVHDLMDFEKEIGPIIHHKKGELGKDDLFDAIEDLLDDADIDVDDFAEVAEKEAGLDAQAARQKAEDYIYTWYIKRFKMVLGSFLVLGSVFAKKPVDKFDVEDVPEEQREGVIKSFSAETEKQLKKADCEKYVLSLEGFVKFLHSADKDKTIASNKKLGRSKSLLEYMATGIQKGENGPRSFWARAAVKLWTYSPAGMITQTGIKFYRWLTGYKSDNQLNWKVRYTYYNLSKTIFDPAKIKENTKSLDEIIDKLELLGQEIFDKKSDISNPEIRIRLINIASALGFTAWGASDREYVAHRAGFAGRDEAYKIDQFLDGIDNASTKQFYAKQYNAKSQYLFDWFNMTFMPIFAIFIQAVRQYSGETGDKFDVDAIPDGKKEEALEAFKKEADSVSSSTKNKRLTLDETSFKKFYLELTYIENGGSTAKLKTNALGVIKAREEEKDKAEEDILKTSIKADNATVAQLSQVDQNISNKAKFTLKNAKISELKDNLKKFNFINLKFSQHTNWQRLKYWSYGRYSDSTDVSKVSGNREGSRSYDLGYSWLEKVTFDYWYHGEKLEDDKIKEILTRIGGSSDSGLLTNDDSPYYREQKLKYLREWYDKRFIPMFWILTKVIEQQHSAGNGKIVDLKNIETSWSDNWDILENIDQAPEMEFIAVVTAYVDEVKKQLSGISKLTPDKKGYDDWMKQQIGDQKAEAAKAKEKARPRIDALAEKQKKEREAKAASGAMGGEERSSSFTSESEASLQNTKAPRTANGDNQLAAHESYSYVHATEYGNPDAGKPKEEPVKKFASGGVITRDGGVVNTPTKLAKNILAGEAGAETILPHKPGTRFNDLTIDAINSVYGQNTAGLVESILSGDKVRESLKKVDITDEELDEPLSSSTDLLLYNIFKKISTISSVFDTLSKGGKLNTDTETSTESKSLFDTISDGVSGTIDTVKSGVSAVYDTGKKVVGGAFDKAKEFLGFDSNDDSFKSGGVSTDELETAKKIWKYFKSKGWSDQAIAGLIGNMYKESRLTSNRMQDDLSDDLSKSKKYTEQVDKNKEAFTNPDGIGYGLCQWTFHTRKEYLWRYTHSKHVSVGNTEAQIEFVEYEMDNLGGLSRKKKNELIHSSNVLRATEIILKCYEKPAAMNNPAELQQRAKFAMDWYHRMVDKDDDGKSVVDTLDEKSLWESAKDTAKAVGNGMLEAGRAFTTSAIDFAKNASTGNVGAIVDNTVQGAKDLYGDMTNSGDVVCPTGAPVITSQFGKRPRPSGGGTTDHMGIDLRAGMGDPIYAAAPGTVIQAGGLYNWVRIKQDDGLEARYLHNSRVLVKKGDKVKAGQLIAKAGISGKNGLPHRGWTSHLHFALLKNGQFLDPEKWLRGKGVKLTLKDKNGKAHMPPMSDADVEVKDSKGNNITDNIQSGAKSTPDADYIPSYAKSLPDKSGVPEYANGSSSYYQVADNNIKSSETAQGATGNANSDVGVVNSAVDNALQDRNSQSTVSTTTTESKPVSTEPPVITTDSVASGNIGTDTSSIGNQQLAELKIISGLLRDIRNNKKTVPDEKVGNTETTLKSAPKNTSETDALSQLIPILQTIADKLSDTSKSSPVINNTATGTQTRTRSFDYPFDIHKK